MKKLILSVFAIIVFTEELKSKMGDYLDVRDTDKKEEYRFSQDRKQYQQGVELENNRERNKIIMVIIITLGVITAIYYVSPKISPNIQKNNIEDLTKYADLLEKGLITKEEFESKKKELL